MVLSPILDTIACIGSLINGLGHVVAFRSAAHRRFHAVLAIVFRDYGGIESEDAARLSERKMDEYLSLTHVTFA